jgi:hypothetical protein
VSIKELKREIDKPPDVRRLQGHHRLGRGLSVLIPIKVTAESIHRQARRQQMNRATETDPIYSEIQRNY